MTQSCSAQSCIIACDIGTTSTKITVSDPQGQAVFEKSRRYPTFFGDGGMAEQNPLDWWDAFCEIARTLVSELPEYAAGVEAISFSGKTLGLIPVDKNGNLTRDRNLIYTDMRAQGHAQRFMAEFGHERFYNLTGGGHSPGMYPAFKTCWFRDTEPEFFSKTEKFLQAKAFVIHRLTGEFVTDPSCASQTGLMDIQTCAWNPELLDATGIDETWLPEIRLSTDVVGEISRDAAQECGLRSGIPIINGGGDIVCASLGSGVLSNADYYVNVGSAAWWGSASDTPRLDYEKRILSLAHVIPGTYAPHVTLYNGASCEEWIRTLVWNTPKHAGADLDRVFEEIIEEAGAVDTEGLLFLGHLNGAGAPLFNPDARGVFFGLSGHHRKAHLYRAVLEGVACQLRWSGEALGFSPGNGPPVRLVGGGIKNSLWRQVISDTLNADCAPQPSPQSSSSLGAAMVGAVGLHWVSDFDAARALFIADEGIQLITPQETEIANDRFQRFKDLYGRLYSQYE